MVYFYLLIGLPESTIWTLRDDEVEMEEEDIPPLEAPNAKKIGYGFVFALGRHNKYLKQ